MNTTIVSPGELADSVYHGASITILASYWRPQVGAGHVKYLSEHIPTALFCDPPYALAGIPSSTRGRNPLPDPDLVMQWFRKWGLEAGRPVVVYDEGRGLYAARAWWILRWAGVDQVSLLDGGMAQWEMQGHKIVGGPGNLPLPCTVRVNPGMMPVASIDEVKNFDGILLDTREPDRFAGRREILDLKAGHIPGAINLPNRALLHANHTFRSPQEIRETFAEIGINEDSEVIIYSGSGNHSAQVIAAMEYAGLPIPKHFIGGWSQWSATVTNPVEIGDGRRLSPCRVSIS